MAVGTEGRRIAGVTSPVLAVGIVAVGHVGALLALPSTPPLTAVLLLEGVLLAVLGLLTTVSDGVGRTVLFVCVLYAVSTALTWAAVIVGSSLLATTLGVVTALLLVGYGVHRYELVALGLVEGADE